MARDTDAGLTRGVRRWDLLALVLNTIVGAGIFGLPSRVFALAGSYSLVAYLACAIPVILIVLCFAEVASRFRATGGPYLYARTAFGPLVGFEVGWLLWLARVTAFAALCNLFVGYFSYLVPAAAAEPWRSVLIIAIVALLTAANVAGVRMTTSVSNVLTVGKLIPLIMFVAVGLFFVDMRRYSFAAPPSYAAFSQAALLLVFAYTAFEVAIIAGGETRDPQRDVPFALLTGIGIVVALYVLIQFVAIGTFPELAGSDRPLADASRRFMGAPGALVVTIGALLSLGGTMNATIFAIPRVLFAMAGQGQLPAAFLATHRRFRTPHVAILVSSMVMLVLTLFSTFISALTISTIIRLLVYIATCAALPVLRRRPDVPPATLNVPAGTVAAVAACGLSVWLLSNSAWNDAGMVAAAIAGVALYYVSGMNGWMKELLPKPWLMSYYGFRHAQQEARDESRSSAAVFSEVYERGLWGKGQPFCSGPGSADSDIVGPYLAAISTHLRSRGGRTLKVVDLGCGDFSVGRHLVKDCGAYLGIDVVPELVRHLQSSINEPRVAFQCLDAVRDDLPPGDVCLVRQVLQHLSNDQIAAVLAKLSRYPTVFITEHYPTDGASTVPNLDKVHGVGIRLFRNSGVYLDRPPFNIPGSALQLVLEVPGHAFDGVYDPGVIRTFQYHPWVSVARKYKYLLGDNRQESSRLRDQARLWDPVSHALFDRLKIRPGFKALEIGPGAGSLHGELRRRVKGPVDAVERSPVFASSLRAVWKRDGLGEGRLWQSDLIDARLPREHYDLIFARWVFLFLPRPEVHLRKLVRALKPGGILAIQDYHRETLAMVPRPPEWDRFFAADLAFFASQGGDASIGGRLPEMYRHAGLAVEDIVVTIKSGRPGSAEWNWLTTYFLGILDQYAKFPPFSRADAARLRRQWLAASREKSSQLIGPALLDIVGRK